MTQSGAGSGAGADARKKADPAPPADGDAQYGLFDRLGGGIRAAAPTDAPAHVLNIAQPTPSLQQQPASNGAAKARRRTAEIMDDKAGHRGRLLTRFRDGGADALPDYELLEIILFRVFPRGDTKPLAKALMAKFKTFNGVVNATDERLMEIDGIGQRAVDEIRLIRVAALRMMQSAVMHREVLNTWASVLDYCKAAQGHDDIERFRILFLDKRNQLIADEVQQSGTVDHTPVYVREIIRRALQLGATALVLVHNHPSGDPSPSRADIDMTKQIVTAAAPLGITIHDHVIVGRQGHFSLKAAKLM